MSWMMVIELVVKHGYAAMGSDDEWTILLWCFEEASRISLMKMFRDVGQPQPNMGVAS